MGSSPVNSKDHLLNGEYSIKEITDLNDLEKLRTVWNNLADKQGTYMPFLCFDWFKIWLDNFLDGNKLLILLLYRGGNIKTIAPFLIIEEKFKGINVRKIELIGNVHSPVRNFLFDEFDFMQRENCLLKIFEYFFKRYENWDIIDLYPIDEKDENIVFLKNVIDKNNFKSTEELYFIKWYENKINYSGDEYINKRSKNIRQELRRRRKKLEELGKLEFKIIKNNDEIDKYMNYYYETYTKSWKKKERIGPTFHRDLAKLASEKGWLRLGFLFLNDVPIASQFRIVSNGVCFFLKTAYNDQYRKYGPGTILLSEMIKYIIDIDNVIEIDFGSGDEPYKKSWASKKREMKRILFFNKNLRGRFLALLETQLLPIIRKHKVLVQIKNYLSTNVLNSH